MVGTGGHGEQQLLERLMIEHGEKEPLDGSPKWTPLTNVVMSADLGNTEDKYGAVVVKTASGEKIGYLPRHTAAFYRDAIAGNTVPMKAAAVVAGKPGAKIGCRLYGATPDSPIGHYPEDVGWTWNPTDDKYGYWTKEGEAPRPLALAELARAAHPDTSDGRG